MVWGGRGGENLESILEFRLNKARPPTVKSSESRLVEAAAAGDREARQALFERHREAAYRAALRITGRHEDALDVVQDAFIRAFDGLAGFQREAGFRTWVVRIASNRALDVLRSRRVRRAASLERDEAGDAPSGLEAAARDDVLPGELLERTETAQRVRAAIAALPVEQGKVFLLYAGGELTYGDIAEAVGIPIGTVMSRIYHARRRLREMLGDLAAGRVEGEESR